MVGTIIMYLSIGVITVSDIYFKGKLLFQPFELIQLL